MELKGIDVSSYQGKPDWKKVAEAKIKVAILRIAQRYGIDSSFEYNYRECRENGILTGVYRYSYALSVEDIKKEAEEITEILSKRKLAFPVWLDLEWEEQENLPQSQLEEMIQEFRQVIISAGYDFGIYCNRYWYENIIPEECKKYSFWIASYPYDDTGRIVEALKPPYGVGWQYSSKGSVPGIQGYVDLDLFHKERRLECH